MNHLDSIQNASDRVQRTQGNFEQLDRSLAFAELPSLVDGVPVAVAGPPADGERYVGELWIDVNLAKWRCTVAGTPGTWIQVAPAVVEADPVVTIDGYVIARVAEYLKLYRWNDGGAAWAAV